MTCVPLSQEFHAILGYCFGIFEKYQCCFPKNFMPKIVKKIEKTKNLSGCVLFPKNPCQVKYYPKNSVPNSGVFLACDF